MALRICGTNRTNLLVRLSKSLTGRAFISAYERHIIGNREVVGFGFNGQPNYVDRPDYPFPAVRWKEPTSDIMALREKEKGDWKLLSVEEKKELYRASFCETFAEFQAPTGEWKSITGLSFLMVSLSLWCWYAMKLFSLNYEWPESFTEESRKAQLRRMIDLHVNPVTGLASKWDYENDCWKK